MAKAFFEFLSQRGLIAMSPATENNAKVATTEKPSSPHNNNDATNPHEPTFANMNDVQSDNVNLPEELALVIESCQKNLEDAEQDKVEEALHWTDLAELPSTNRQLYIRSVLEKMVEDNECVLPQGGCLSNTKMPSFIDSRNAGRFKHAMVLVTSILTDDQKKMLALSKRQCRQVPNFTSMLKVELYSIEKNAGEKMKELDGQSRTTVDTILGLGNRYGNYLKNNSAGATTSSQHGQPTIGNFFSSKG